jgi:peroxiredoxin-like protein
MANSNPAQPKTLTCRTTAEWLGRRGVRFAADAAQKPPMLITNPPEFNGRPSEWTPEDLLVGSIETCLLLTFTAMVERDHLPVEAYYSEAEGVLQLEDGRYHFGEITIRPTIIINDREGAARVLQALDAAHRECLVANSVSASVVIKPDVVMSVAE